MAYKKDSRGGFLKNVNSGQYTNKKSKSIFKRSEQEPVKSYSNQKSNSVDWDIPDIDEIEVPELDIKDIFDTPQTHKYTEPKPTPKESTFTQNKRTSVPPPPPPPKSEFVHSDNSEKNLALSFRNILFIIAMNIFVPVIGGFVFYVLMLSQGEKQKASQSIALSIIVSIIRLIYLYNTTTFILPL